MAVQAGSERNSQGAASVTDRAAVLVFCRAPELEARRHGWGHTGIDARRALYAQTVRQASRVAGVDVLVFHRGEVDRLDGVHTFAEQRGATFGERLEDAVARARRMGYTRVVVVGTDVPHLRPAHLRQAFELLDAGSRLVLGADASGGCYLIGLHTDHAAEVLSGVTWQRGSDLDELRSAAGPDGVAVLPEILRDLDSADDVLRLCPRGLTPLLRRKLARVVTLLGLAPPKTDGDRAATECVPATAWSDGPRSARGPPAAVFVSRDATMSARLAA